MIEMQAELIPKEVLDWHGLTFSVILIAPPHKHKHPATYIYTFTFTWNACISSALNQCWALADTTCLLTELSTASASETSDKLVPFAPLWERRCVGERVWAHAQVKLRWLDLGSRSQGTLAFQDTGTGANNPMVAFLPLLFFCCGC